MSVDEPPHVFRVGGSVLRMFQALTVVGLLASTLTVYLALTGGAASWGEAAAVLGGTMVLAGLCVIVPGVLSIDVDGLEIRRRLGTQRLRWSEIRTVRWQGHGGEGVAGALVAMASDDWQLSIEGTSGGKPVTMILTGPSVERQAEVRELLAARLPGATSTE